MKTFSTIFYEFFIVVTMVWPDSPDMATVMKIRRVLASDWAIFGQSNLETLLVLHIFFLLSLPTTPFLSSESI